MNKEIEFCSYVPSGIQIIRFVCNTESRYFEISYQKGSTVNDMTISLFEAEKIGLIDLSKLLTIIK